MGRETSLNHYERCVLRMWRPEVMRSRMTRESRCGRAAEAVDRATLTLTDLVEPFFSLQEPEEDLVEVGLGLPVEVGLPVDVGVPLEEDPPPELELPLSLPPSEEPPLMNEAILGPGKM